MVDEPPKKGAISEPTKHVKQTRCLDSGPVVFSWGNRQNKGSKPGLETGSQLGFQSSTPKDPDMS